MSIEDLLRQSACGCCKVAAPPTPEEIFNRPGLSAIRYRIGSFSSFRQAMIEALPSVTIEVGSTQLRPLAQWTARVPDDYGIALLEMMAYVGDILTFYQERIANEAFLRTALLRESILRLAALLDYEPAPGVAATAHLVFTAEKDKQVRLPIGLRAQSVPGQDEKPQKFEAQETIIVTSALNSLRIYPEPTSANPFQVNATEAILKPSDAATISGAIAPGEPFVIFNTASAAIEDKQVASIRTQDGRTTLSWVPKIDQNFPATARAFKFKRKLRAFGYNAPATFLRPTPDNSQAGGIKWVITSITDNDFIVNEQFLSLDARYDDLKSGTPILLQIPGSNPRLLTITSVEQVQKVFGPLTDTVTRLTVSGGPPPAFDRRRVVIYELSEPEIRFWNFTYASNITGSAIVVKAEDLAVAELEKGRSLILSDNGQKEIVTVQTADSTTADGAAHTRIFLTSSLTKPLNTTRAVAQGNVALATHGEKVTGEVLGSGDASKTFQSFQLRKSPVTFVPQPGAPNGAASTLNVRVDGVLWHEVDTLFGHGGDERVYTTSLADDDVMTVQFGNGINGALLPTGRNNVVADYRKGIGRVGNVNHNTLTILLDRPVGLKAVTNPIAARGGADRETGDQARKNAPNTVRTFERIVSLKDFEDAANQFAGVAKARAAVEWDGLEQAVQLVVAGDGGAVIAGPTLKNLVEDLNSRRDYHRKLTVRSYVEVYILVEATIEVDPDFVTEDVQAAVGAALLDYFAFDNLDLGQPIHLSNVYQALQNVNGVVSVDIDRLRFKALNRGTIDAVQNHLLILFNELARIEQPDTDVSVRVRT